MKHRWNFIVLFLALVLFVVTPLTAAMETPVQSPDPQGRNPLESLFFFEDISTVVTTGSTGSDFHGIPATITRYDLIKLNETGVKLLQQQIHAGNDIQVRFRGSPYHLVMEPVPVGPLPGSDQFSYKGSLNQTLFSEDLNYFITLSFYNHNTTLSGVISEQDGPFTIILALPDSSSDTQLYYVYSSADEKPTGARMDNDVLVKLPSGESKPLIELSPEELDWWKNEQRKLQNQSAASNVTLMQAPLSSINSTGSSDSEKHVPGFTAISVSMSLVFLTGVWCRKNI